MSLTRITNAILGDENTVLTVSNYDAKNDVFVGMPAIIGRNGIEDKVYIEIDKEEERKLENSIKVIKEAINKVEE
jgi:L-lactate dehydrogenase